MSKKYHFITYGCQMNVRDTQMMEKSLQSLGMNSVSSQEEADLVVVNTCTVRDGAEQKAIGKAHELKQVKKVNPSQVVVMTGCVPAQPGAKEELKKNIPHLDLLLEPDHLHELPIFAKSRFELKEIPQEVATEPVVVADSVSAYVTIMQGCDNFCTYCIVPYTRGAEKSRTIPEILSEIKALLRQGVREITLLGQNVNSYGKDLEPPVDFADLLAAADELEGLARIRYTSPHPREFTQKVVETIRDSKHVCEHFHMPLQAGSDRTLAAMERGYTQAEFLALLNRIRQEMPGASITTDIIVGFPGETEEDFQETLRVIKEIRFDMAHTYMFSPRKNTPAATMDQPVPLEIKKDRLRRLMDLQNQISYEVNQSYIGQVVEVLVEGPSKKNPNRLMGRTSTNKIVIFDPTAQAVGSLISLRIVRANTWTLEGESV